MKAVLVIDISDRKLKKYNEKIEDLSISYTVNGRVENYASISSCYLLKPLPSRMEVDYDTISSCEVTEKVVAIGWNACVDAIVG